MGFGESISLLSKIKAEIKKGNTEFGQIDPDLEAAIQKEVPVEILRKGLREAHNFLLQFAGTFREDYEWPE